MPPILSSTVCIKQDMEVDKKDESARGRIGDFLDFKNLTEVLEKISNAGSNDRKKEILKKYVNFLRTNFANHYRTLDSEKAEVLTIFNLLPHLLLYGTCQNICLVNDLIYFVQFLF